MEHRWSIDPKYGMGWQDPRGWSVYFGQNTQEIEMKKKIYQAILDTFLPTGHPAHADQRGISGCTIL